MQKEKLSKLYGGETCRKETNKGYGSFYRYNENGDFALVEKS